MISHFFKKDMSNICCFQLLTCVDFLLFFVFNDSK